MENFKLAYKFVYILYQNIFNCENLGLLRIYQTSSGMTTFNTTTDICDVGQSFEGLNENEFLVFNLLMMSNPVTSGFIFYILIHFRTNNNIII